MTAMLNMLRSLKGIELALFSILLIACQYFYVSLARNTEAGFELYASAWFMAVLTAMTLIKASRLIRKKITVL